MPEALRIVREAAGCTERCYVEVLRDAEAARFLIHHFRGTPSLEATIVVTDRELRMDKSPRKRVIERFEADHAYWEEGLTTDFDEDAERARLVAV